MGLVSAVIQIDQKVDEGWPLEVVHPHKPGLYEVYLQPGEIVLYEGARLQHGRPQRFVGTEFASIFSHFHPTWWTGESTKINPHYMAKPRVSGPMTLRSNEVEEVEL